MEHQRDWSHKIFTRGKVLSVTGAYADFVPGDVLYDADLGADHTTFHALITLTESIEPQLQAGDADQDLDFDQLDLVRVQVALST